MKRFKLALALWAVSCCVVYAGGNDSPGELCKKITDDNVYFVAARRQRTTQQETNDCLFRAASQISMRMRVSVTYTETTVKDAKGKPQKKTSSSMSFTQGNTFDLADRMKVLKTERRERSVAMLVSFSGSPTFKNIGLSAPNSAGAGGNPSWVSNPPKGSGFYAAVGRVNGSGGPADSFQESDANAICALAQFTANPTITGNARTWKTELRGAYIARRWYNAKERMYYSLAILPR